MKWRAMLLFLSLLAGVPELGGAEPAPREVFDRALDVFDRAQTPGDFLQAALLWEGLRSSGIANGALEFNLGNAYLRAGRPGQALAAYRRAQRLLPRDPYVDANLRAALAAVPQAPHAEAEPWWKHVCFWHAKLAQRERLWLAAAAWLLAFGLACVRLYLDSGAARQRRLLGTAVCLVLVLAAVFSASAGLGYGEESLNHRAVVVRETSARKGNGESYAPAFEKPLPEGAEGLVVDRRGEWVAVNFGAAGEGWVKAQDVAEY